MPVKGTKMAVNRVIPSRVTGMNRKLYIVEGCIHIDMTRPILFDFGNFEEGISEFDDIFMKVEGVCIPHGDATFSAVSGNGRKYTVESIKAEWPKIVGEPVLWVHGKERLPVGKVGKAYFDESGNACAVALIDRKEVDLVHKMKIGVVKGFSVGGLAKKNSYRLGRDGVKQIQVERFAELTITPVASYRDARFTIMESLVETEMIDMTGEDKEGKEDKPSLVDIFTENLKPLVDKIGILEDTVKVMKEAYDKIQEYESEETPKGERDVPETKTFAEALESAMKKLGGE